MKNNKRLIVIVSCLLLVISVSLAYYIGELLISGEGATCHANGTSTTDSIAVANIAYNPSYNKTEYVGLKYT